MNTSKAHFYTSRVLDQGPKRKKLSDIHSVPPPIFSECCNFSSPWPPRDNIIGLVVFFGTVSPARHEPQPTGSSGHLYLRKSHNTAQKCKLEDLLQLNFHRRDMSFWRGIKKSFRGTFVIFLFFTGCFSTECPLWGNTVFIHFQRCVLLEFKKT